MISERRTGVTERRRRYLEGEINGLQAVSSYVGQRPRSIDDRAANAAGPDTGGSGSGVQHGWVG